MLTSSHAAISQQHIVPQNVQRTDHHIPTPSTHHSEVGRVVDFEDLDELRKARRRCTRKVFFFFFSTTRRLWRLRIAESAKSFLSSNHGQNG
jgi:hypothetical protein